MIPFQFYKISKEIQHSPKIYKNYNKEQWWWSRRIKDGNIKGYEMDLNELEEYFSGFIPDTQRIFNIGWKSFCSKMVTWILQGVEGN